MGAMVKAILEFNLPEDAEEHKTALKAGQYYCAIDDTRNLLRKYRKYGELTEEQYTILEKFSEEFYAILTDRDID